jgi:hypothetical protein
MLVAALRRFSLLFGAAAAGIAAVSLLLGLALGASLGRSLSLGFYTVGSFLLVAGFFIGNRGPMRLKKEGTGSLLFGSRVMRRATSEEREEAINSSAVFVAIGLGLIVLGVLADSRYRLL